MSYIVAIVRYVIELLVLWARAEERQQEERTEREADEWELAYQRAVAEGDADEINRLLSERRRHPQ